ncbi:MAG: hypothetical protein RBR95_13140 [Ignavibacteriaceae bacterium]|jgi:hypothetical protein|nr:hypothetical protein [Ignavibacteriaceae bacterium]
MKIFINKKTNNELKVVKKIRNVEKQYNSLYPIILEIMDINSVPKILEQNVFETITEEIVSNGRSKITRFKWFHLELI